MVRVGLEGRQAATRVDHHELAARARRRRRRPLVSGAVIKLPFDASGFAPNINR
jgi:hypothetical protein